MLGWLPVAWVFELGDTEDTLYVPLSDLLLPRSSKIETLAWRIHHTSQQLHRQEVKSGERCTSRDGPRYILSGLSSTSIFTNTTCGKTSDSSLNCDDQEESSLGIEHATEVRLYHDCCATYQRSNHFTGSAVDKSRWALRHWSCHHTEDESYLPPRRTEVDHN